MFKIGETQDGLGFLAIKWGAQLLLHGLWPPCHKTMIGRLFSQLLPDAGHPLGAASGLQKTSAMPTPD
jgi:hypothetical protein